MNQMPDTLPSSPGGGWMPLATSRQCDAPAPGCTGHTLYTPGRVPYTQGLEPAVRSSMPGYDSGVLCMLLGAFMLVALNFRNYGLFFKNFRDDLLSVRVREKTFSVRTFSETGVQASLVFIACLAQGIIVGALLPGLSEAVGEFALIGGLTLAGALYYLWQLGACWCVGAVFAQRTTAAMWLKGFNATQSLTAMLLSPLALVALFNPEAAHAVAWMGAVCWAGARLVFICKGFRLFYDNLGSLVYFILYLCSLEIVPLAVMWRILDYACIMLEG